MKNNEMKKRIYRLEDYSADYIVERHLDRLHHQFPADYIPKVKNDTPPPYLAFKTEKNTTILREKFTYLIHLLISRSFSNGRGFVSMNAVALETIFGKDYKEMRKTLFLLNILYCDNFYKVGKKALAYAIPSDVKITFTYESPSYLSKYADKAKRYFDKFKSSDEKRNRSKLDNDSLYNKYNKSLSLFKLEHEDEAKRFISLHKFVNPISKMYYQYILDKYIDGDYKSITSVDNNKRIYHIGTSTPRLLKPFLNIKFSADIHNSHPLLFNSLLFDNYGISIDLRRKLSHSFNLFNIPSRNVRQFLRKTLIHSDIKREEIANVPADVLEYLYLTSKGLFWDGVIDEATCSELGLLRTDIKVLMFAEVFYSKTLNNRGKEYGKQFRKRFPNVYKVVRKQKKTDRTRLANEMMRMESELFSEILTKLYNKRFKVISIHDAVVVLETKSNALCTEELVSGVIKEVYMKRGLSADVSIDRYGEDYMHKVMEKEASLNERITKFMDDLKHKSECGDEASTVLIEDIGNGELEMVYNRDCTDIILHPTHARYYLRKKSTRQTEGS